MPLRLWALIAALTAVLLGFSQTVAFFPDEGFHLLAARLVNAGKRPYLDFFYQHAPLWIYISAGWMRLFGDSWRSVHALSALLTAACAAMVARYAYSRFRGSAWRKATAASAALLTGLSYLVIEYGTIAMAYGLALFATFAAFLLAVGAMDQPRIHRVLLAGLCAGTAAAALLLTAPVPFILFLWLWQHTDPGSRTRIGGWFFTGVLLPFLPLFWLALHAPRNVLFDVIEYQLFYRATWADRSLLFLSLRGLASWLSSVQALLLILLAAISLTVLVGSQEWDQRQRREFRLCAWLVAGLAVFLATPLPTFPPYFILVVPFLSILASVGIHVMGSRLWPSARPIHVLLPIALLFALGLAKSVYPPRPSSWQVMEELGREVARVTPENGLIYAPQLIVFASGRLPPAGMENTFGPFLRLPPERLAGLRIVPESEIDRRLSEGEFDTVVIPTEDPRIERFDLLRRYAHHQQLYEFYILSDLRR
jgi:4-amino-4-deoxy-L-arabinose transferase-like glycosyltransferase